MYEYSILYESVGLILYSQLFQHSSVPSEPSATHQKQSAEMEFLFGTPSAAIASQSLLCPAGGQAPAFASAVSANQLLTLTPAISHSALHQLQLATGALTTGALATVPPPAHAPAMSTPHTSPTSSEVSASSRRSTAAGSPTSPLHNKHSGSGAAAAALSSKTHKKKLTGESESSYSLSTFLFSYIIDIKCTVLKFSVLNTCI